MRISISPEAKAVMFWLTNDEKQSPGIMEKIMELAAQYRPDPKYKTVIFQSGTQDYIENTKQLLRRNC